MMMEAGAWKRPGTAAPVRLSQAYKAKMDFVRERGYCRCVRWARSTQARPSLNGST
jgi:hypothetical protein